MPLFRFIDPPEYLADATYDFRVNPDPAVYVEVLEPASEPEPAEPTEEQE